MKKKKTDSAISHSLFVRNNRINREYSWLMFNERVLDQACSPEVPLLERCKFLSIFCSNLDEFFMVRVGSLINQLKIEPDMRENKTGLTPAQQIRGIMTECRRLYKKRDAVYSALKSDLKKAEICIDSVKNLTPSQLEQCRSYFFSNIMPLLSPLVLDAKHPLIHFENLDTYMVYELEKNERTMYGIMTVHPKLDTLVPLHRGKKLHLVPVEEIVRAFGDLAFPGYKVKSRAAARVARNADFDANVEDADIEYDYDFSKFIKRKVELRGSTGVVRLETDCDKDTLTEFLYKSLNIKKNFVFMVKGLLNYKFLMSLQRYLPQENGSELRYPPFRGYIAPDCAMSGGMIERVRGGDVFLSYPYDSMEPLVKLVEECSVDPRVVSIKITIYRVDSHSRIVDALKRACENGKEVVAVFELCARFDEENNLYFANLLQEAGCTVLYGVSNYKVHSKVISIVLSDSDGISYITHLGTGNYNENTAKLYTDLNIITADREIGEDAAAFFRNIGVLNLSDSYKRLLLSPHGFKAGMLSLIKRETDKALSGQNAHIFAKMNSLTDKELIDALELAGKSGVRVDLIVRGICCLLPGVEGVSDNITVRSIVGRFLEHSRVYCFGDGEDRITYISSADFMTRNTDRRVEIATPVLNKEIEDRILHVLETMMRDNVKARELRSDGRYYAPEISQGDGRVDAQEELLLEELAKVRL